MSLHSRGDDDLDGGVRTRLREALGAALKERNMIAASALRSALGAIGNAEAVDPGRVQTAGASNPHFAGTAVGLGAGEAARRNLSEAEAEEIVRAEIAECHTAAGQYELGGHADRARRLRLEAQVLTSTVDGQRGATPAPDG